MDHEQSPSYEPVFQDTPPVQGYATPCRPRRHDWTALCSIGLSIVPFIVGVYMIEENSSPILSVEDAAGRAILLVAGGGIGFPLVIASGVLAILRFLEPDRQRLLPRIALLAVGLAALAMLAGALLPFVWKH